MKKKLLVTSIIISILIFIVIALSLNSGFVSFIDSWLYGETIEERSNVLTFIMLIFTTIGGTVGVVTACILLFISPKIRKNLAWPVVISVIVAAVSNNLLKILFERPRPDFLRIINADSYSFPSGHAMISMALYFTIAIISIKYIKNKKFKYGIFIFCLLMPLLIGISRIYLGVHYFSDVIGGWVLGFVIAAIVSAIYIKKNEEKHK